ncbi:MAG: hypothetical protein KF803_11770 [Cyclobacteriaceae bacterium]|nr:hypothetical protein [Cyclobacteriaceae bacterium]
MKKSAHILAVLILIFNGVSACFGGWMLTASPDGSSLGMTVSLLEHSPFGNFLIPGIVLFTVIGLLSLVSAYLIFRHVTRYSFLTILMGLILIGWIVVQAIMIQTVNYLHVIFVAAGLLLIVSGLLLRKQNIIT